MKKISIIHCVLITLLLAGGLSCRRGSSPNEGNTSGPGPRRANLLLITVDTLRADYLSCYGSSQVKTPNMDALAASGARFEEAMAQVPLTTPSHASILTGTYPPVHTIRDVGGFVLDKNVPTLAELARNAGLQTAAFVSAAVLHHQYGMNRGFDTYNDDMGAVLQKDLLPGVVSEIRGEIVTRRAIDWLNQAAVTGPSPARKNFFLWVHYYDPHFPYDPPGVFKSKYARNLYAGEVAYADEQLGLLLKRLEELGLRDNTLIVLMADHGEGLGDHGEYTHGVFLYDATMHIPLIMSGPGISKGQVISRQVRSVDVMPSMAGFLGISAGAKIQGVNLMPALLEGKAVFADSCYMETVYPKTSMGWSELRALRTDRWKFITAPNPELYDLQRDKSEKANLIDQFPTERDQLKEKLWEIAGPAEFQRKLERQPVTDETLKQLQSLGYASAGNRRELRMDQAGPDPKDRVIVLGVMEKSADLMNHDQFRKAIPLLEGIQKQDPSNPSIYQKLGICWQRVGQFAAANKVYEEAIRNHADSDQTHADMGSNYIRMGQLQPAINAMEKAADMSLTNLQNLTNLATAYIQMGRLADAQKSLKAILTQNPRAAEAYNLMGMLAIQQGDGNSARAQFEKALEFDPGLAEPCLNLGLLAQNANRPDVAIDYYRKFLEKANPIAHRAEIPKVRAAIRELEMEVR